MESSEFDEDIFHDTLIKCMDKFNDRKFDENEFKAYITSSFKMNVIRSKQYYDVSMKSDTDVETLDSTVTMQFNCDFNTIIKDIKEKFGNELSIVRNSDITQSEFYPIEAMHEFILNENAGCTTGDYWYAANMFCEFCYMKLLEKGWTPQQARRILPLDLKTEVIYTAYIDDWIHLLKLRTAPDAHPDFREIAIPLKNEFITRGYINGSL